MFVIGTAGHVDHGKSTLVQALSGINPDRLKEEQERAMTIDLGFAWLTLPSGREVSIVDVPGHEDFIKNMLAGIGGIDIALLVVAADEAVMPQTREHLAILDLLEVRQGVVALTKIDLIEDPDWIELVQEEIREQLSDTSLSEVPIVPVSAVTGQGLETLLETLDLVLDRAQPRRDIGRPRLPIDRAFTIAGFGTIVTGTLIDGQLHIGQEVAILPEDLSARIRGLQSHKTQVEIAEPGSRVAVNLSGIDVSAVYRGQVLTSPGWLRATRLFDAHLRVVQDFRWPVEHSMIVDVYSGSARVQGRVRLLDKEALEPGESGWVQIQLREPMALERWDRFIIRLPSPSLTIGGGEVLEPHPVRRHRRFRDDVIRHLEMLATHDPTRVIDALLNLRGKAIVSELVATSGLDENQALAALRTLATRHEILLVGAEGLHQEPRESSLAFGSRTWKQLEHAVANMLREYHARFPLRSGMPREEFRARLHLTPEELGPILAGLIARGQVAADGQGVRLATHRVQLSPDQEEQANRVLRAFAQQPFTPPTVSQVIEMAGETLLQYLIEQGKLVKISDQVLFTQDTLAEMERGLRAFLREHGQVTVAQVRDLFQTSRRYALAFLEEMDRRRITRRLGDRRVLRHND